MREHTVFPLKNKIIEPENTMQAGTNATRALTNVTFMESENRPFLEGGKVNETAENSSA